MGAVTAANNALDLRELAHLLLGWSSTLAVWAMATSNQSFDGTGRTSASLWSISDTFLPPLFDASSTWEASIARHPRRVSLLAQAGPKTLRQLTANRHCKTFSQSEIYAHGHKGSLLRATNVMLEMFNGATSVPWDGCSLSEYVGKCLRLLQDVRTHCPNSPVWQMYTPEDDIRHGGQHSGWAVEYPLPRCRRLYMFALSPYD